MQQSAGNAATAGLVTRTAPKQAAPVDIARVAATAPAGVTAALLGTPAAQAPPAGFQTIQGQQQQVSLSGVAGITLIQHSGAFTAPVWARGASPRRQGSATVWQPTVNPAQAQDVVHQPFFPAAGDHDRFPAASNTEQVRGQTWRHVLRVTAPQAAEIQRGEQEHLNDAALAFALTYQRIADAINEVAALTLPPRPSYDEAVAAADAELARRIPALGADPRNWPAILDRLLSASTTRDTNGSHTVTTRLGRRDRAHRLIVWELDLSGLRLGTPSNQIVIL